MTRTEDIIRANNARTLADPSTQERLKNMPISISLGSFPANELFGREDKAKQYLSDNGLRSKGFDALADLDDGLDTRGSGILYLIAPKGTPDKQISSVKSGILNSFK